MADKRKFDILSLNLLIASHVEFRFSLRPSISDHSLAAAGLRARAASATGTANGTAASAAAAEAVVRDPEPPLSPPETARATQGSGDDQSEADGPGKSDASDHRAKGPATAPPLAETLAEFLFPPPSSSTPLPQ